MVSRLVLTRQEVNIDGWARCTPANKSRVDAGGTFQLIRPLALGFKMPERISHVLGTWKRIEFPYILRDWNHAIFVLDNGAVGMWKQLKTPGMYIFCVCGTCMIRTCGKPGHLEFTYSTCGTYMIWACENTWNLRILREETLKHLDFT